MKNTKRQRAVFILSVVVALVFGTAAISSGMHIMEGFLPLSHAVVWGVVCIPFVILGIRSIQKTVEKHRKTLLIFVMMGAYVFVLSALKIPSVTGSSSHPTGTGLGAILFGPTAMCLIGVIVLLFQALLLAHGGITTLGANTFSMGIVGPFIAVGVFAVCKKLQAPKSVGVFLAASLADLGTYLVTSVQLAMAHPSASGGFMGSLVEFMTVFALTQIPLAIIEGLLAVVIVKALEAYAAPELGELGYLRVAGGEAR